MIKTSNILRFYINYGKLQSLSNFLLIYFRRLRYADSNRSVSERNKRTWVLPFSNIN